MRLIIKFKPFNIGPEPEPLEKNQEPQPEPLERKQGAGAIAIAEKVLPLNKILGPSMVYY